MHQYIYALTWENKVFYVGRTTSVYRRYFEHVHVKREGNANPALVNFIRNVFMWGQAPDMRVLEFLDNCDLQTAQRAEMQAIKRYAPICNIAHAVRYKPSDVTIYDPVPIIEQQALTMAKMVKKKLREIESNRRTDSKLR